MTTLEQICQNLHRRYEDAGEGLTRLELKLVTPRFQAKEAESARARELHEEVRVLRLRHDEAMRRINDMHAASDEDLQTFQSELNEMADDLDVQVKRLTAEWAEAYGDDAENPTDALRESAARLDAVAKG